MPRCKGRQRPIARESPHETLVARRRDVSLEAGGSIVEAEFCETFGVSRTRLFEAMTAPASASRRETSGLSAELAQRLLALRRPRP